MASDFSSELNLVAHYTFAGSDPFGDKSGKGNDLYHHGGPSVYTADKKEGSACALFQSVNYERMYVNDTNLSADFPGKNGIDNTTFTVCGWYKPSLLSGYRTVASKSSSGRCWSVGSHATSNRLWVCCGHASGWYDYYLNNAFTLNDWSFVAVRFDDSSNTCNARVYNQGSDAIVTGSWTPANALRCAAEPFVVGATAGASFADGLIDNLCIFSRLLSDDEIDGIRAGSFDFDSESNLVARYRMEAAGLNLDALGSNSLRSSGIPDQTGPRDDLKAVLFDGNHAAVNWRPDTDLSSDFPGKDGSGNNLLTVVYWFQPLALVTDYVYAVCKMEQASDRSWFTGYQGVVDYTWLGGVNSGLSPGTQAVDSGRAVSVGTWYHVGIVLDDANDRAYIRLFDTSTGLVYAVERTNFTVTWPMTTVPFSIGNLTNDAGTGPGNDEFYGLLAEVAVFTRGLSATEIDKIREGTYGAVQPSNKNMWLGMHW